MEGRLTDTLRDRRIAVVLAGGGALGAYEIGVLRVLERIRVRPAILAGVSVGALNAVAWLAHDFRTQPLERIWGTLRASQLGLRWTSLMLRALGGVIALLGFAEALLTLLSSQSLSSVGLFRRRVSVAVDIQAVLLDVVAWLVIGIGGFLMLTLSRPVSLWFGQLGSSLEPGRTHRWLGRVLLLLGALHLLTLGFAVPWPHRFSATVILFGATLWLLARPGQQGDRARRVLTRLLPETRGRGLWPTEPRSRVLERLVSEGEMKRLISSDTHLVVSACDLQSGKIVHFINWRDADSRFRQRIAASMGEVMPLGEPRDLLRAALASSAIPLVYEPVTLFGRDFVDAGLFSNQPIHVALADDAEAVLVVLLSPSSEPAPGAHEPHVVELGGRLIAVASWRELQSELSALPREWTRGRDPASGAPARICVVEPEAPLPGGVLAFDATQASELMRRGEADAWRALAAAGWISAV